MVNCWVCGVGTSLKGEKIQTLLKRFSLLGLWIMYKKIHVDSKRIRRVFEIYGDDYIVSKTTDEEKVELRLPSEFKSLLEKPKGINPLYRKVVQ